MTDDRMRGFLARFERWIVLALLVLMLIIIVVAVLELVHIIVQQAIIPPRYLLLDSGGLLEVLGAFLMVLIALELMETVKMYLDDDEVHVEVVLLVAVIAISRKIIILDIKTLDPLTLIGIARVVLSLCLGYVALKKRASEGKLTLETVRSIRTGEIHYVFG